MGERLGPPLSSMSPTIQPTFVDLKHPSWAHIGQDPFFKKWTEVDRRTPTQWNALISEMKTAKKYIKQWACFR